MDVETIGGNGTAEAVPNLALEGVTKTRCPKCQHEQTYTGPVESPLRCGECGTPTVIVATTGATVSEAIERAAQQVPAAQVERQAPKQPTIPGLRPRIDWETVGRSILELRAEVRSLAVIAERKSGDAKLANKAVADKQAALNQLEDDYQERLEELEADVERDLSTDEAVKACLYERQTGQRCAICRAPHANLSANATTGHLVAAARQQPDVLVPGELRALIFEVTHLALPFAVVEGLRTPERQSVLAWLEAPTVIERPTFLGTPHVVSEIAGQCRDCGALLHPESTTLGLDTFPVGTLVGTDCPGPVVEEAPEPARVLPKRHAKKSNLDRPHRTMNAAQRREAKRIEEAAQSGGARGKKAAHRKGRK